MWNRLLPYFGIVLLAGLIFVPTTRADEPPASEKSNLKPRDIIAHKLTKKIDWSFNETPLEEVVEFLKKDLNLPIYLDKKAISDLGLSPDDPLTFKMSGISAKTGLKFLLRQLGLTFGTQGEVLLITSPDVVDNYLYAQAYDVADLVCFEKDTYNNADFDSLSDLITTSIKPTCWSSGYPIRFIEVAGIHAIVFDETEVMHAEVAELLTELRAARHPEKCWVKETFEIPATLKLKHAAREKIRMALDKPVSFHFSETPLTDVANALEKTSGVPLYLDRKSIRDIGGEAEDLKITFDCENLKLRTALNLLLRELGLTWTFQDEVLIITSPDTADNTLFTVVYDVADLPKYRTDKGDTKPDSDDLFSAIEVNVQPNTWSGCSGPGSIVSLDVNGIQALVITQTWQAHEEISNLLDDLRKLRNNPPTKEELEKLPLEKTYPTIHQSTKEGTPAEGQRSLKSTFKSEPK